MAKLNFTKPPKNKKNKDGLFGGFKAGKSQRQQAKTVKQNNKKNKKNSSKSKTIKTGGKTTTNKIPTIKKPTIIKDPNGIAGSTSVTGARFKDQTLKNKIKSKIKGEGKNKKDDNGLPYWEDAEIKGKKLLISEIHDERKLKLIEQKERTIKKVNKLALKITNPNNVIPRNHPNISTNDSILNDDVSDRIYEFYSREDVNEKNQPGYVKKELTPEILVEEYTKLDENKIDYATELDLILRRLVK